MDDRKKSRNMRQNFERGGHLIFIDLLDLDPRASLPEGNGYMVIGELSRSNKLPNAFLNRYRWPEPLQIYIAQMPTRLCACDSQAVRFVKGLRRWEIS
jgi:hypothetical protein